MSRLEKAIWVTVSVILGLGIGAVIVTGINAGMVIAGMKSCIFCR